MKRMIRIGSGQGFWGDLQTAPFDQVSKGPIDYLMMDFLAEVTMSIMQKQKRRDPEAGYAKDLLGYVDQILPVCAERGIKLITNGGGANPEACCDAIIRLAKKKGITGLRVGIVTGDDILPRLGALRQQGHRLASMETGEDSEAISDRILSANVYFGAGPIVEALTQGADIVVTGRTTDTGLTLAPMMYEFGWKADDWDKLAAGTVAGHILECGGQSSGGNFSADWRSVPDLARIGFPIAEAYPGGEIVITKHENTGGLVSLATVKEQLLYEIGDPRTYITPDCIADFTSIRLAEDGPNRVRMSAVRGKAATDSFKVSMAYLDGYTAIGTLTYCWPDALEKAQAADAIVRKRLSDKSLSFEEIRTEFVGFSSSHGPLSTPVDESNEVMLRIGVRDHNFDAVESFTKEIAPLILTGPPGATGFAGGRPKAKEVVAYWPALIAKSAATPAVTVRKV
jgi:hypothetical protein